MRGPIVLARIFKNYQPLVDFPCLYQQYQQFSSDPPFIGLKVLHATPVFENALAKILPLVASGADLVVVPPPSLPFDRNVISFLKEVGVKVVDRVEAHESYDIIYDCMGAHAQIESRYGAVELTRSGSQYYSEGAGVCIQIDDGRLKLLEDLLGTSEGLMRSLREHQIEVNGQAVLLFGFGKVGKGVYLRLTDAGALVTVVERTADALGAWKVPHALLDDRAAVAKLIQGADVIITATGATNIFADFPRDLFFSGSKKLINIGAEDEFGVKFDKTEIFNQKHPANFILEEPTRLKYLDATFALHNQSALDLMSRTLSPGIHPPRRELEESILFTVKEASPIWDEVRALKLQSLFT